jgi:hypothetical protein
MHPDGGVPSGTYISRSSGDFMTSARLKDAMGDGLVDEHLIGGGMKQSRSRCSAKGRFPDLPSR